MRLGVDQGARPGLGLGAARRRPELPGVLPAELARALVAYVQRGRGDGRTTGPEQPPRLEQAELLLVLQRGGRGHGPEMLVERRHAHADPPRELGDLDARADVAPDVADGAGDRARVAVVADQVAEHPAERRRQEPVVQLSRDERAEHRRVCRCVGEAQVSEQGVEQLRRRPVRLDGPGALGVERRARDLVVELSQRGELDREHERQAGRPRDPGAHGEVVAHEETLSRPE